MAMNGFLIFVCLWMKGLNESVPAGAAREQRKVAQLVREKRCHALVQARKLTWKW